VFIGIAVYLFTRGDSGSTQPVRAAPAVAGLTRGFLIGSEASTDAVPLLISCSPSEDACRFELQTARSGGKFTKVGLYTKSSVSTDVILRLNQQHRFRLRAFTCANEPGPWAALPPVTPTMITVSDPAITYTGHWEPERSTRRSTSSRSSLAYSFTGTNIAWLSQQDSRSGRAEVLVDGTAYKAVDLHSTETARNQIVMKAAGPHPAAIPS
jgi:hypothetical protein